ncbi:MAG: hypothetical protein HY814_08380 [Candidatus Riflebacteria bacterium]|nr:hypothetical protein [Candidatus Riflebacteria bacterium]
MARLLSCLVWLSLALVLMPAGLVGPALSGGHAVWAQSPGDSGDTPSFDGLASTRTTLPSAWPTWMSRYSRTVVFLGDSLTEGPGIRADQAYPALLQHQLDAAGYPLRAINAGVSGNTSAQGLARIDALLAKRPLFLVVNFGTNDANLSREAPEVVSERLRRNLDEMVTRAHAKNTWVVLIPTKLPNFYKPALVSGFAKAFEAVSKAHKVPLGPGLLDGVWGNGKLWLNNGHPNAAGHRVVAGNVWQALEPVVRKRLRR